MFVYIKMMCFNFVLGKEKWMDQDQRLSLVKKYEDGIIDHHSTDYEKYGLNCFTSQSCG